ncbi:MAG: hypothetical protein KGZ58_12305, partial [Ignavibacteriales bacterium]|nr:hypothetical protein [Ignavibacteriales bacterium]
MNITYADWSSPTTISVYPEARSGYFGVVGTFPNTLRENTNVMRGNIPLVGGSFGDSYGTAPAVSEVADEVSDITGEVLGVAEVKGRVATELSEITDGGSDITDVVS